MPISDARDRTAPRGPVLASAVVFGPGTPPSEHLSYDLSAGGIRLCGYPAAHVGDGVALLLRLDSGLLRLQGHLLRVGADSGRPDFVVRFSSPPVSSRLVIERTVHRALEKPPKHPVLLLDRAESGSARGWLAPVLPLCAIARTPLGAVQHLESHSVELGLVYAPPKRGDLEDWKRTYPETPWRRLDDLGRLHLHA